MLHIQNPYIATTGSPDTPCMCVNAIDENGKAIESIMRSHTGQLYIIEKNIPLQLEEKVFETFLRANYKKIRERQKK